ncbi:MAG: HAD hydrolase family protein [candidate division Zixibacteria bacterium]|nr:HAD hydrolase family protein [candidate division Zixibacteria bacterium]
MPIRRKSYLTKSALAKRLADIKALVLDVDGVLTDDHLYVGSDGFELKKFHIGDGLTMVLAIRAGLEIIIMSNRHSPATTTRMNDLMVKHVIQERGNKATLVADYVAANNLGFTMAEAAFIGNDIMDIPLMHEVGLKICVNDAYDELKAMVDYVTVKKGGHGAVREVLELYFKGRGLQPADFLKR